ncbi:MAG: sigma-54 dependent transcriptional regulator [Candidatus Lernaella stagnicola]|nr:sigma-54 dependent transcriptional regulator [Candidatus Lernaella stagnicola]
MERRILIVDDEPDIRETLGGILEDEGYEVKTVGSGEEALRAIAAERPDLVMLDIWMPGIDGMETLARIKKRDPELQVIMISGHGSVETAVKAIKMGAYDFIEKPLSLPQTILAVNRVMKLIRLEEENVHLKENIEAKFEMIGRHPAILKLREQIELAAPTDGWVLVTGENGTGKELVARQIHMSSRRAKKPFIEVNCAAIPDELIESELFGHEKGAFTGATDRRRGKFDLADGGAIFLDEIADMSLKTQAKVLRVLQEQRFERVGGSELIPVDVRVIAATNKDLLEEIAAGRFREDLYYRLNVIPLHVPPLRERRADIALFVGFFSKAFCERSGLPSRRFADDATAYLSEYDWPGNVRELKNIIERLVIMTRADEVTREQVVQAIKLQPGRRDEHEAMFEIEDFREARAGFEREFLKRKLEKQAGNVTKTAEHIGLERTNLHRKIKALGLTSSGEDA